MQIATRTRHLHPHLRYVILGAENVAFNTHYQREVVAPAQKLNDTHPGYITIAAPGARIPELINALDIFCLTSKAEGVPIALFEAGSIGLPVLSTNVGSISEVIEDGVTGYLFQRNDTTVSQFATRIEDLVSQPKLRETIGSALRQHINKDFSADTVAQTHADAYQSALTP